MRKEVEGKGIFLPPSQTGFRKELRALDNIHVLNYLINRQISRKKRIGDNVCRFEGSV